MFFENRRDAGWMLALALQEFANRPDVLVLALPRGGVPVAYEVARQLRVPLDVFVVRKLGAPGQEELAMGAIASGGVRVLNQDVVNALGIGTDDIERTTAIKLLELERQERAYRGKNAPLDVRGRTVILIDDGIATGSTMRAAAAALRRLEPARIIAAVPVAARPTCVALQSDVDEVVCLRTPEEFYAVGQWYKHFNQTTDEEVRQLLEAANMEEHTSR